MNTSGNTSAAGNSAGNAHGRCFDGVRISRDNCLDAMRYFFAISLVIVHYATITDTPTEWIISGGIRVKFFFTITGMYVTYSFVRRGTLKSYFAKRFARIIPAYLCAIIFCLVLGAMLTTLPQQQFWTSGQTWRYTICNLFMLNWLEPSLPGVFCNNPLPQMDGSLWTMKFEALFYLAVPLYVYLVRRFSWSMLGVMALLIGLAYNFLPSQLQACCYFFTGSMMLAVHDFARRNVRWLLPLAVLMVTIAETGIAGASVSDVILGPVEVFCLPVIFILLTYCLPFLNFIGRYDNITYGMFLYHFPVVQTLIVFFPDLRGSMTMLIVTFFFTCLLATVSWRYIEKPIINLCHK